MSTRNTVISGFKINIYNQWFSNFPKNVFETAEFWRIIDLTAILRLLEKENSIFLSFIGFIVL